VWAHESRRDKLLAASQLLRLVPSGLGAHAAARAVLARSMPLRPSLRTQKLAGGATVQLDLSDRAQAQAYLLRRYEPDVVALIARVAPPGGVFFDVGANIGLISLSLAALRPDLAITAFEPDSGNVHRFRRNLELNAGVAMTLEESAVGSEQGERSFVGGSESGWGFIATTEFGPGTLVAMTSLDSYTQERGIPCIDALKIDVEGYEPLVLQGAASLLQRQAIRLMVCELEDVLLARVGFTRLQVISELARYGYQAQPIPPVAAQRLRRRSLETSRDLVFTPNQRSLSSGRRP
jgi:FkbM family methyltransferase